MSQIRTLAVAYTIADRPGEGKVRREAKSQVLERVATLATGIVVASHKY